MTALLALLALGEECQQERARQQRRVMGAICAITAEGGDIEKAFDEIARVDAAISNWRDDSELAKLHRDRSIQAGPELLSFVRTSLALSERTEGAFDITVGPLVKLWGKKRVPSAADLEACVVGWNKIQLVDGRITLPDGAELDPGAIGKGIAVDRALDALRQSGAKRALVDFGSTIGAIGEWTVAIRDPFAEGTIGTVTIRDESLSTSGHGENFFVEDGKRYGHILDPRTRRPVEGMAQACVIAPTATESDALSTAVFVLKRIPEKIEALVLPEKDGRAATGRFERVGK